MFARAAAVAGTAIVVVTFAAVPASADGATVTMVAPGSGAVGTTVAVTGSGLATVTAVAFPGAADVPATVVSDGEVDAVVPVGAHSGALALRSPSGDVAAPLFTVLPTATLSSSVHSVVYPATATLSGQVSSAGIGIPGQPARLESRVGGTSTWVAGPTATSDAGGTVHFTVKPLATTAYRVVFDPTASFGAATSGALTVIQHPSVSATAPALVPILTTTHVHGYVHPAQTGRVALERYYSHAWHRIATGALSSTGHYSLPVKLPAIGTFTYRVRRPADARQAGNVSRPVKVLGVHRSLRSGMHGVDVTALQKRLKALHYDLGRVTGTFGFDTVHAVVAFEKVQGMHRDGVVGAAVWKALSAPKRPRLRHPLAGVNAVEVDLTKQVLYFAVDGHITRILDSSTGGGYWYVGSDGTSQRAITPTGHFSIKYKIDHWVTAKLGVLYRPAYFNYSGYAIHGEPLVPAYPASHGCVRITVPAMDRLYRKLTDGMSVWIYRS